MNKTLAAASFALIAALSGVSTAHATGFNDRSAIPDTVAASQAGRQDLSYLPAVHGFNQKSHHADAARAATLRADRAPLVVGAHCDQQPRIGFNESTSFASC
jgi:hypothetical protein